jgi:hypothetical protein
MSCEEGRGKLTCEVVVERDSSWSLSKVIDGICASENLFSGLLGGKSRDLYQLDELA